ncbi:MAG: hypothetical protein ACK4IK_02550 [Bacteroidia bacterium]
MKKLFVLTFILPIAVLAQDFNYANIHNKNILSLIGYYRVDSIKNSIPFIYNIGINKLGVSDFKYLSYAGISLGGRIVLGNSKNKTVLNISLDPDYYYSAPYFKLYSVNNINSLSNGFYFSKGFVSVFLRQVVPVRTYFDINENAHLNDALLNIPSKDGWYNYTNIGYYTGINLGYSIKQRFDIVLTYNFARLNNIRYFNSTNKPNNNFSINKIGLNVFYFF